MLLSHFGKRIGAALKRGGSRDRSGPAAVPESVLVYAIGDIHGRSDLLRALAVVIAEDCAARSGGPNPTVVFLGDYVDRGPDSRGVIDFLLNALPSDWECRFLKGNHEEAVLRFLEDPAFGDVWRDFGGLETLASYGISPARRGAEIDWADTARAFARALPTAHLAFLKRLSLFEQIGDYIFVHAGVRPRIPLAYQSEKDLLWIREEFTSAGRALPQTVVHGHTPAETVVIGEGRIGLDTGAYLTGRLTAARFRGSEVWYLST